MNVLNTCDYILCEDTRHSRTLLQHYEIQIPLKSFHKFNQTQKEELVIEDLKAGKTLALISDAGTPLISDPGYELVVRCRQENLPVSAIPGACALIQALTLSGFPSIPFQFIGFLPKKNQELHSLLSEILRYPGTTVTYETPHRIEATLNLLHSLAPTRPLCLARELTKHYEECVVGTPQELLEKFQKHPPRGEMVLLISPNTESPLYEGLPLEELVEKLCQEFHLTKQEAIKQAAKLRGLSKREVYNKFLHD